MLTVLVYTLGLSLTLLLLVAHLLGVYRDVKRGDW